MCLSRNRAFTLRELLVAMAIISALIALAMPMFVAHRERARRAACVQNLKELALACHMHHDRLKRLPPASYLAGTGNNAGFNVADLMAPIGGGGPMNGYSWITRVLPYVKEGALFSHIDLDSAQSTFPVISTPGPGHYAQPGQYSINLLRCPSVEGGRVCNNAVYPRRDYAVSNYACFAATHSGLVTNSSLEPNGTITNSVRKRHFGRTFASITDGTSDTLMLVETCETSCAAWIDGSCNWLVGMPWKSPPGRDPNSGFLTASTTTIQAKGYRIASGWNWGPSSVHSSGTVNHALVDGSVRSISAEIDASLYIRMISADGAEPGLCGCEEE